MCIWNYSYTISENGIKLFQKMIYRGQSHSSWDIKDQNIQKDANSAEIWQNFSTSNPNISETVSHSITKFHFLRERDETFQTYIYKSKKIDFDFLLTTLFPTI